MKNKFHLLVIGVLVLSLLLSACGRDKDFSTHSSNEGFIPEEMIPNDVGMMFSYSLRHDEQYAAMQNIETALGDSGRVSRTLAESWNAALADSGLDYDTDLAPAFGEQFRMIFAGRPDTDTLDAFSVVTLEDPKQMEEVFGALKDAGSLEEKKLSKVNAYVSEETNFYASIYEDLLLVANRPEALVEMIELGDDESLWDSERYQDSIHELGSDYLFYGLLYPDLYTDDLNLISGLNVSDVPALIDSQAIVVRAEDDGFSFDVDVKADKELADEAGFAFDSVPKEKPYMFENVPSDDLIAYFESYGMAQTFDQIETMGDTTSTLEGLETFFRSYFAMDFQEDVLSFLDKGYVLAVHQNGDGIVPGITIIADVSSDSEGAQSFLDKLDGQISGLMLVLESALPGAVTKGTTEVDGTKLNVLEIDLASIPTGSGSALPAVVTSSALQLLYGIKDETLMISTAEVWEKGGTSVADSALYASLKGKLSGADEGLMLIDAQGISGFASALRALREQLELEVSDSTLGLEDLLKGFLGGIASSSSEKYETHFSGFLMISE